MDLPHSPLIGIIGLGYVGLPLAVEFGKYFTCIGFDIDEAKVNRLNEGIDHTGELSTSDIKSALKLTLTASAKRLSACNIYIVTVPTPINAGKQPDLKPLKHASQLIASTMDAGNIVIYESTVYPGCTEEICIPTLEACSSLKYNQDFFVGYSPERINPGDKQRHFTDIIKVTSGSTPEVAEYIDKLYRRIISAGTHKASSIKVAEASKVIENTQRDVNIALINELALIFKRLNINTEDVLNTAATKWNFLPFRPGLVGGHCIGVDPYYLAHKAELTGYHPQIISASRRINEQMGFLVATEVMRLMTQKRIHIVDANILIMGLAFKENCADLRNTRVKDIFDELTSCNCHVDIYDPWVSPTEAKKLLGIELVDNLQAYHYDAVILAVAHDQFRAMNIDQIRQLTRNNGVVYDIKYMLPSTSVDGRL